MNIEDQIAKAAERMHNAPLASIGKTHKGHRFIQRHTTAWADASREWMRLRDQQDRDATARSLCGNEGER